MRETENYVRDLHAGVVNVVLHFDAAAGVTQDAAERVAEDGVAQMADVRGLVGIDAGVLDHHLGRVRRGDGGAFVAGFFAGGAEKCGAVEEEIQVAAAGDFDALDAGNIFQRIRDLLCERARRFLHALGQLEAERRSDFAHGELRRALGDHGHVRLVALVDVVAQRLANAVVNGLVHVAPWVKWVQRLYGKRDGRAKKWRAGGTKKCDTL